MASEGTLDGSISLYLPSVRFPSIACSYHVNLYLTRNTLAVKIAGSIMTMEIENGKDQNLATTAAILNTVALSPLLNASLSFLNVGYVLAHLTKPGTNLNMTRLNKSRSFTRHIAAALKPLHLLIIFGLILSVSGGISRTKTSQNSLDDGARELQAASGVFALTWVLMAFACFIYVANIYHVQRSAKRVRINYTVGLF